MFNFNPSSFNISYANFKLKYSGMSKAHALISFLSIFFKLTIYRKLPLSIHYDPTGVTKDIFIDTEMRLDQLNYVKSILDRIGLKSQKERLPKINIISVLFFCFRCKQNFKFKNLDLTGFIHLLLFSYDVLLIKALEYEEQINNIHTLSTINRPGLFAFNMNREVFVYQHGFIEDFNDTNHQFVEAFANCYYVWNKHFKNILQLRYNNLKEFSCAIEVRGGFHKYTNHSPANLVNCKPNYDFCYFFSAANNPNAPSYIREFGILESLNNCSFKIMVRLHPMYKVMPSTFKIFKNLDFKLATHSDIFFDIYDAKVSLTSVSTSLLFILQTNRKNYIIEQPNTTKLEYLSYISIQDLHKVLPVDSEIQNFSEENENRFNRIVGK